MAKAPAGLPERSCECGRRFTPTNRRQRFCCTSCRVKAAKARARGEAAPTEPAEPSPLVVAVRSELATAGVLGSFLGQLALVLAARVGTESGLSISRELRAVMAEALDGARSEPERAVEPEPEPDELAEMREARDRIARHAAAGRA